ncbi:hypothetical protein MASR1M32_03490 [Rhodobacter sp.]
MLEIDFDAVVCGGGHNGLVAAHYLRASGLSVCVVEKNGQPGGLCRPVEFLPGFRGTIPNSPGSFEPMIMRDMDLLSYGLKMQRSNPSVIQPFEDGRAFVGWRDPARLDAEYRKFSVADARRAADFVAYLDDFAKRLGVSVFESPPDLASLAARMRTARDQEDFNKLVLGSARDLVAEWFESPEIQTVFGFLGQANGSGGPGQPGTAMAFLNRPMSLASTPDGAPMAIDDPRRQPLRGSTGLPVGGMGSIVEAMVRSLGASGVQFRCGLGVRQILVGKGGATEGVVLDDGTRLKAGIVVSAANPKTTLLDLLEPGTLEADLVRRLQGLRFNGSAFKAFLVLDDIPRFA